MKESHVGPEFAKANSLGRLGGKIEVDMRSIPP